MQKKKPLDVKYLSYYSSISSASTCGETSTEAWQARHARLQFNWL